MSARNGTQASTLDQLRHLGRATSTQLARSLGSNTAADVVLTRLRKLEDAGKVVRVGTDPSSRRPSVIWAVKGGPEDVSRAIVASNSEEFAARGGTIEVLPGFVEQRPNLVPVRQVYRGRGGI